MFLRFEPRQGPITRVVIRYHSMVQSMEHTETGLLLILAQPGSVAPRPCQLELPDAALRLGAPVCLLVPWGPLALPAAG